MKPTLLPVEFYCDCCHLRAEDCRWFKPAVARPELPVPEGRKTVNHGKNPG